MPRTFSKLFLLLSEISCTQVSILLLEYWWNILLPTRLGVKSYRFNAICYLFKCIKKNSFSEIHLIYCDIYLLNMFFLYSYFSAVLWWKVSVLEPWQPYLTDTACAWNRPNTIYHDFFSTSLQNLGRAALQSLPTSLHGHNSMWQGRGRYRACRFWMGAGGSVCFLGGGGVILSYFPLHLQISKRTLTVGVSGIPGLFSTQETKHGAESLHRIKQSLNASSCYTLPNETFMKGPLMRFQKHLVISPGAAEWRSVDVWMNGLLAILTVTEEWLYEWRCLWFYRPICNSHWYCLLFHLLYRSLLIEFLAETLIIWNV